MFVLARRTLQKKMLMNRLCTRDVERKYYYFIWTITEHSTRSLRARVPYHSARKAVVKIKNMKIFKFFSLFYPKILYTLVLYTYDVSVDSMCRMVVYVYLLLHTDRPRVWCKRGPNTRPKRLGIHFGMPESCPKRSSAIDIISGIFISTRQCGASNLETRFNWWFLLHHIY